MRKLLRKLLLCTLIVGIFGTSVINAEDFTLEIPVDVEVNGGTIEIDGDVNLPEVTQIQNKGTFTLKFTNPQVNDEFLYRIYQIDKTDNTLIYDETIYEVRVHFLAVDDNTIKANVTVNEELSEEKSAEIVFVNTQKVGNVLVVYETEDGDTLKEIEYVCKNCILGKDFITNKLDFEGYDFSRVESCPTCVVDENHTVTGKVEENDIIIRYLYKQQPPAPKVGNVLVVHKADTGEVLKEVEYVCKDCEIGTPFDTSSLEFEGYEFVRIENCPTCIIGEQSASGEVIEGDIIVVYIYKKKPVEIKKGTLTVIYKTEDGTILKELNSEGKVGDPYNTEKLSFDGYTFSRMDSGSAAVSGEYIDGHLVVTYIYKKPAPVIPVPKPIKELISTGAGRAALGATATLFVAAIALFIVNRKKKEVK